MRIQQNQMMRIQQKFRGAASRRAPTGRQIEQSTVRRPYRDRACEIVGVDLGMRIHGQPVRESPGIQGQFSVRR